MLRRYIWLTQHLQITKVHKTKEVMNIQEISTEKASQ
jgi:hypothetical protein